MSLSTYNLSQYGSKWESSPILTLYLIFWTFSWAWLLVILESGPALSGWGCPCSLHGSSDGLCLAKAWKRTTLSQSLLTWEQAEFSSATRGLWRAVWIPFLHANLIPGLFFSALKLIIKNAESWSWGAGKFCTICWPQLEDQHPLEFGEWKNIVASIH